jgi:dipeptidyl aminopeptidase/acylaminoacyl peptidase
MTMRSAGIRLSLVFAMVFVPLLAETTSLRAQLSHADYARAERLLGWNTLMLVSGTEVAPNWLPADRFWYLNRVGEGREFVLVDAGARARRPAFDHVRLAAALSVAADTSYEPFKLPFREFKFVEGGTAIRFQLGDSLRWTCAISDYSCAGPDTVPEDPVTDVASPDGRWVAFERDENLWIREVASGEEVRLSDDGVEHHGYAVNPEGCCTVVTDRRRGRGLRPILSWSPDSRKIATLRLDERQVEQLHLLETATGRPKIHSYRYALPGDSIIPTFEIYIFDIEARSKVRVDVEPQPMDFGVVAEDSVWMTAHWGGNADRLFFTRVERDRRKVTLLAADAETGSARAILEEEGPTLVELNLAIRGIPNWRVINGDGEVVWFSERDGWGHLYLFDAQSGALKNQITSGPWVVVNLLDVDERNRWVYFTAVGREHDRDIYFRHLYRARLDGSSLQLLTPETADHDIRVSPSGQYFVDSYSRRDTVPVTVLRGRDGRVLQTIEEGDVSRLLEVGWRWPKHFVVKARDGVTDLHGYLYLPSNFDADGTYPIIDYIYPGPQVGPIGWRSFRPNPWGDPYALAELGFIVMQIDAMGTPYRSKAFHDRWYGDMGDNGIIDHVVAIKQLAARIPQIDLDRVGIFGHSGGGFSSTDALLRYPDFFKVAVSSAGNHDNRSYFYAWGERYQGQLEKNEDGSDNYDSQANQNLAGELKGKLLLMYGTLDDNVHPNATLLLIDELIESNKDFDLIALPNRNHGYSNEPYVIRRTWDYFVEHLLGLDPPKEYEISRPPQN